MDTFKENGYPCKFGLNHLQNVYTEYSYLLLLLNTNKVYIANIKIRKTYPFSRNIYVWIFKSLENPREMQTFKRVELSENSIAKSIPILLAQSMQMRTLHPCFSQAKTPFMLDERNF